MKPPIPMTLAAEWAEFERMMILNPLNAGEAQRQEMRRAFYAGALAAFALLIGMGDDSVDEAEGTALLDAVQKELAAFQRDVASGRA